MRNIHKILFTVFLLLLLLSPYAQSNKKVCQPLVVTFENFQKHSINFTTGLGASRSNVDNRNFWNFNGQAGVNYFPINYLELGIRVKPTIANNKVAGKTTLIENNLYVRYYPLFLACYKIAVFTGAGVFRDGSVYSIKGESISKNKLHSSITAGLIAAPKPTFQLETYSEIFINGSIRYNFGIVWNFKSFNLK